MLLWIKDSLEIGNRGDERGKIGDEQGMNREKTGKTFLRFSRCCCI
jgi:hypothetical protein